MICRKCGSRMDLIDRTSEGSVARLRYVCPKASCQETSLVIQGSAAATAQPLTGRHAPPA